MSLPANSEFEIIEAPPPDYSTLQIIHHLNYAPPPYEVCVQTAYDQRKLCWSTAWRSSCARASLTIAIIFGSLLVLCSIILLALQQVLHNGFDILGWCLFGTGTFVLLIAASLCRSVAMQNRPDCCYGCASEEADASDTSTNVSTTSCDTASSNLTARNCVSADYANPPVELNGPPPYQPNAAFARPPPGTSNIRLTRIPIASLSSRVQPMPVHLGSLRAHVHSFNALSSHTREAWPANLNVNREHRVGRSESTSRVTNSMATSTPLALVASIEQLSQSARQGATAVQMPVQQLAQERFAVNRAYVTDETLNVTQIQQQIQPRSQVECIV